MNRRTKRVLLGALRDTGLSNAIQRSRWRSSRLLILCYHGISLHDEHLWDPELYMPREQLRTRLEVLRKGRYNILPLGEALTRLKAGDLPERSVCLTFDDGFYDFYARACPLLREFDAPATVYLTTYYSHFQRPVFDPACSYILWSGRGKTIDGHGFVAERGPLPLGSTDERRLASLRIRQHASESGLSATQKDHLLQKLAERLGVDYSDICRRRLVHIMTPEEVCAAAGDLVDVQLHTHRHRTPDDRPKFEAEIQENRASIESTLGAAEPREHFCYPSGQYRSRFLPWLRELRVVSATTCDTGLASPESELLLLPRLVDTTCLSSIEFESWLSGSVPRLLQLFRWRGRNAGAPGRIGVRPRF